MALVASVAQLLGVTDTGLWLSFSHLLSARDPPSPPHPFSPPPGMDMTGIPRAFGSQVWHCQGGGRCEEQKYLASLESAGRRKQQDQQWHPPGEKASPVLCSCVTTAGTALTLLGATSPLDGPITQPCGFLGAACVGREGQGPQGGEGALQQTRSSPSSVPSAAGALPFLLSCLGAALGIIPYLQKWV